MNWTPEQVAAVEGRRVSLPPAVGRVPRPLMNKTEAAYDGHLELQLRFGQILWHQFEAITIRLGNDCRFTPDQLVMLPDGHLELHDTKGTTKIKQGRRAGQCTYHAEEDALVKARVAAANFVIPVFFVWQERNGEWSKKEL